VKKFYGFLYLYVFLYTKPYMTFSDNINGHGIITIRVSFFLFNSSKLLFLGLYKNKYSTANQEGMLDE
jgi:hypothetical protein